MVTNIGLLRVQKRHAKGKFINSEPTVRNDTLQGENDRIYYWSDSRIHNRFWIQQESHHCSLHQLGNILALDWENDVSDLVCITCTVSGFGLFLVILANSFSHFLIEQFELGGPFQLSRELPLELVRPCTLSRNQSLQGQYYGHLNI